MRGTPSSASISAGASPPGQDVGGQAEVAFQQDEWLVAPRRAHDERGPGSRRPARPRRGSRRSGRRTARLRRRSAARRQPRPRSAGELVPVAPVDVADAGELLAREQHAIPVHLVGKPRTLRRACRTPACPVSSCRRRTFSAASERSGAVTTSSAAPARASARPTASSNRDEPSSPRRKIATISSSLLGRRTASRAGPMSPGGWSPSGWSDQYGLWATSQAWPSGS